MRYRIMCCTGKALCNLDIFRTSWHDYVSNFMNVVNGKAE